MNILKFVKKFSDLIGAKCVSETCPSTETQCKEIGLCFFQGHRKTFLNCFDLWTQQLMFLTVWRGKRASLVSNNMGGFL